jgi:repressor LexA
MTLTPRQKQILDFIRSYREEHGVSPAQREICERFGFSSFGTLQKHLKLLMEKGALVRDWNKRRSLLVAEEPAGARALELPLFGRIAAGQPIEVLSGDEKVPVPEMLTRRAESYANYVLKVTGDSMVDDGIRDGDYVIVQRRETASNGEMAAVLVNGEATLKRVYREPDGRVRLQPANERMAPIFVSPEVLRIQGVVVGLMRRY